MAISLYIWRKHTVTLSNYGEFFYYLHLIHCFDWTCKKVFDLVMHVMFPNPSSPLSPSIWPFFHVNPDIYLIPGRHEKVNRLDVLYSPDKHLSAGHFKQEIGFDLNLLNLPYSFVRYFHPEWFNIYLSIIFNIVIFFFTQYFSDKCILLNEKLLLDNK